MCEPKLPLLFRDQIKAPSGVAAYLNWLLGCALTFPTLLFAQSDQPKRPVAPLLKKGEKQLFVDSVMIREKQGITRVVHPAKKLEHPVLSAEMPWECAGARRRH